MKTKTQLKLIVALFAMIFGFTVTALGQELPSVGGPTSTAMATTSTDDGRVTLMSPPPTTSPEVRIFAIPVILPAHQDPRFWPVATQVVKDQRAGLLTTDNGYALCRGKITATNLVAGPNNSWWTVQLVIDVRSVDGEETVDLAGVRVVSISLPSTILNSEYMVNGWGYGPAAVGEDQDGLLVVSGVPTKKVRRVTFVVQMALFTANIEEVKYFLLSQGNFTIRYEVRYGASAYVAKGMVSLDGYGQSLPSLVIARHQDHILLDIFGVDSHRPFYLQSSSVVDGNYHTIEQPAYLGDKLSLQNPGHGMMYFRLRDTGW